MRRAAPSLTRSWCFAPLSIIALGGAATLGACSGGDEPAPSSSTSTSTGGTNGGPTGASDSGTSYPPLPPYTVDDSPLPSDYAIFDHAKECHDRFQVEVPSFDCDGPDSSRIKIEVNGAR